MVVVCVCVCVGSLFCAPRARAPPIGLLQKCLSEEPEVLLEALSKRASPKSNPRCRRGVQRPLPLAPLLGKQLHLASASTWFHLQIALISISWGDEVI